MASGGEGCLPGEVGQGVAVGAVGLPEPAAAGWSGAGALGEAAAAAQLAQDGNVQLDGDQSVLTTFAGLLDKFDPDFDLVTP